MDDILLFNFQHPNRIFASVVQNELDNSRLLYFCLSLDIIRTFRSLRIFCDHFSPQLGPLFLGHLKRPSSVLLLLNSSGCLVLIVKVFNSKRSIDTQVFVIYDLLVWFNRIVNELNRPCSFLLSFLLLTGDFLLTIIIRLCLFIHLEKKKKTQTAVNRPDFFLSPKVNYYVVRHWNQIKGGGYQSLLHRELFRLKRSLHGHTCMFYQLNKFCLSLGSLEDETLWADYPKQASFVLFLHSLALLWKDYTCYVWKWIMKKESHLVRLSIFLLHESIQRESTAGSFIKKGKRGMLKMTVGWQWCLWLVEW